MGRKFLTFYHDRFSNLFDLITPNCSGDHIIMLCYMFNSTFHDLFQLIGCVDTYIIFLNDTILVFVYHHFSLS